MGQQNASQKVNICTNSLRYAAKIKNNAFN